MIYFAFIISLVTCALAIITDYKPNEPKRFQMLLYWVKKPIIEYRERIEKECNKKIKEVNDYCNAAIKGLDALDDCLNPIYTQEQKDKKLTHWLTLQEENQNSLDQWKESKLEYEWYLKPIILCVYCMPSFWGSILWVAHLGFNYPIEWLTTITMSVFINAFIWNLYLKTDG